MGVHRAVRLHLRHCRTCLAVIIVDTNIVVASPRLRSGEWVSLIEHADESGVCSAAGGLSASSCDGSTCDELLTLPWSLDSPGWNQLICGSMSAS